jgi:tRNA modification GTPase
VELIDTAGLDEKLAQAPDGIIEKESQRKSVEILQQADLVLLVLDNSQSAEQVDEHLLEKISSTGFQPVKTRPRAPCHPVLTVLNKSDLSGNFDTACLPKNLTNIVQISAKYGTGIENLCEKIRQICGAADFDLHTPVCFTDRQENLLKQLENAKSTRQATSIITELLNGQV